MDKYYRLVIKTDRYAGNFEREAYCYMTGLYCGCAVGSKIADSVQKDPFIIQFHKEWVASVIYWSESRGQPYRGVAVTSPPSSFELRFGRLPPTSVVRTLYKRAAAFGKECAHRELLFSSFTTLGYTVSEVKLQEHLMYVYDDVAVSTNP